MGQVSHLTPSFCPGDLVHRAHLADGAGPPLGAEAVERRRLLGTRLGEDLGEMVASPEDSSSSEGGGRGRVWYGTSL